MGNTSACAEKSTRQSPNATQKGEIPPRVRRRGLIKLRGLSLRGNTSACAEKSGQALPTPQSAGKYLRVCGEEKICFHSITGSREIPPRVRRRGRFVLSPGLIFGNTSACAEKRRHTRAIATAPGKYLRVCGEETGLPLRTTSTSEIPPRVRRREAGIRTEQLL